MCRPVGTVRNRPSSARTTINPPGRRNQSYGELMFDGASSGDPMPLGSAILLGAMLIAAGILLVVVALKSRSGTLPRNWVVGLRTPLTLASDEAWDTAHRAGAPALMVGAVATIVAGVALLFRPANGAGLVIALGGVGWLLGWVFRAAQLGIRAARALDDQ